MPRWAEITKELSAQGSAARLRDASAFWEDFRARAPLHPQHALETARPRAMLRWSLAAACTLLLLAGGTVGIWRAGGEVASNTITALDIATPYRAVFIMNDKQSGGTILWIDCDIAGNAAQGGVL